MNHTTNDGQCDSFQSLQNINWINKLGLKFTKSSVLNQI
jgi:hypothetical protein